MHDGFLRGLYRVRLANLLGGFVAKKKKAHRAKKHAAAEAMARKIFEALPEGSAKTGPVYCEILERAGVPRDDARAIAGRWMLAKAAGKA